MAISLPSHAPHVYTELSKLQEPMATNGRNVTVCDSRVFFWSFWLTSRVTDRFYSSWWLWTRNGLLSKNPRKKSKKKFFSRTKIEKRVISGGFLAISGGRMQADSWKFTRWLLIRWYTGISWTKWSEMVGKKMRSQIWLILTIFFACPCFWFRFFRRISCFGREQQLYRENRPWWRRWNKEKIKKYFFWIFWRISEKNFLAENEKITKMG